MVPRGTRALLLLSLLSLLIVSPATARAEHDLPGEVVGSFISEKAETCTSGTTAVIPVTISHQRCVGGEFRYSQLAIVATRGFEESARDPRVGACKSQDPDLIVPFATRENTLEGRGRIGPVHTDLGEGTVVDPHGIGEGPCRVRIEGAFHRVGKVTIGRLFVDVHVDTSDERQFRHTYCARFELLHVPTIVAPFGIEVLITAIFEGRECVAEEQEPVDFHGRTPFDDIDPLHHDECNAPPSDLLGERGVTCYTGMTH